MSHRQTRKRARDLQYIVYRKVLHPEFFDIQARRKVDERYYQAEIWITSHGHAVTVRSDQHVLVEVVAKKGAEVPRRGIVKRFPIQERGLDRFHIAEPEGISYTTEFTYRRYPAGAYRERHDTTILSSYDQRVLHTFPAADQESLAPFTLIDFHPERGRLRVEAVHAYPHDLTLVTISSAYEI